MSPRRDLWHLAWPAAAAMAVRSLYRVNDQWFVQSLGVEAQAAVAVGSMVSIWFLAFGEMVGVGNLAIAGRRLGAGDEAAAKATVRSAVRLSLGIGLLLALGTATLGDDLARLLVPDESAAHERDLLGRYLFWIGAGQIVFAVLPAVDSSFMAHKRARVPLVLETSAVGCNVVLNALLVPHLGVEGAGLATALSRLPPLVLGIALLRHDVPHLWSGPASLGLVRRILKIGLPTGAAIALYSLVYQVMLAWTFPRFGAAGRSALGPGFAIESTLYTLYWGVGYAIATLVARELGAGRPDRAADIVRFGAKINLAIGIGCAALFWLAAEPLVRLLADDPEAVAANVQYLHWTGFAQPPQAMFVAYEECLIGAGRTGASLIATGTMNVVRIPLAHLFAVTAGMGLRGIWLAIVLSATGKFVWCWILFVRGGWRTHEV